MSLDTAHRPLPPAQPAGAGPAPSPRTPDGREPAASAVAADLERRLAVHAARAGLPAPAVAVLGTHDVLRSQAPDAAAHRAAAVVHLAPDAVLVGPWGAAGPGDGGACGSCLAVRWQRLRTRTERDALETGGEMAAAGGWPVLTERVVDAVAALYAWSARPRLPRPDGLARVTRYDLESGLTVTWPLLAEPLCAGHGAAGHAAPDDPAGDGAKFALSPRPKPAADRYRLRTPSGYALPTDALANPVCGVLGAGVWNDVTSPTTAPVAGTVFMRGYAGLTDVTWSGQANSFAASRDLAFLEGLERYAGTHRRTPGGVLTASYDSLGDRALDPRECGLYAPRTYREDPMIAPFDPARPIPWVRGHSLRDDRPVLVPARLVYYSAGTDADHFVFECSNGCATGSCLEEAVLFGLLELIERDAFLLAWYGDAPMTEIDLDSCGGPAIRAMVDRAALCGYDVHVYDNRIDLPVPVATGLAVRRDGGPGTLAFAAGAALDPLTAVESAVSEILTYLPHLPRQVAERPAELAAMAEDFDLVRRLPDHAALFGLPSMARHVRSYLEPAAVRDVADAYASWERDDRPRGTDLRDDVHWLRDVLAGAGFDVIVVDQTTPEQRRSGLHTVCTIVPGLLPIDFGWARQRALTMPRLRTAQRRAGLRADDLREDQLRLVPHPFP